MLLKTLTILLLLTSIGCGPTIVKHPDAPMLVESAHWNGVDVAIYDTTANSLIHYGRVKVPEGWTLQKYDWEAYIDNR